MTNRLPSLTARLLDAAKAAGADAADAIAVDGTSVVILSHPEYNEPSSVPSGVPPLR